MGGLGYLLGDPGVGLRGEGFGLVPWGSGLGERCARAIWDTWWEIVGFAPTEPFESCGAQYLFHNRYQFRGHLCILRD